MVTNTVHLSFLHEIIAMITAIRGSSTLTRKIKNDRADQGKDCERCAELSEQCVLYREHYPRGAEDCPIYTKRVVE